MNWDETRDFLSSCLPREVGRELCRFKAGRLQEIRVRAGQQIVLKAIDGVEMLAFRPEPHQVGQMAEALSEHALYARGEEVRQGYVTLRGGHRMGLCGRVLCQGSAVRALRDIASLSVRIAAQWPGAADQLMDALWDGDRLRSLLIVGAPGTGKTSLLRDVCRQLSSGNGAHAPLCTGLIDERGELAACVNGVPQLAVGPCTDVLDGCMKGVGVQWFLRALSPEVLLTDELGGEGDVMAVTDAIHAGVPMIATVHGQTLAQALLRPGLQRLLASGAFDACAELETGAQGRIRRLLLNDELRRETAL